MRPHRIGGLAVGFFLAASVGLGGCEEGRRWIPQQGGSSGAVAGVSGAAGVGGEGGALTSAGGRGSAGALGSAGSPGSGGISGLGGALALGGTVGAGPFGSGGIVGAAGGSASGEASTGGSVGSAGSSGSGGSADRGGAPGSGGSPAPALVVVGPASATIHERSPGNATTFTVALSSAPSTDVVATFLIAPDAADGISVSPMTLTFSKTNFSTPQVVTVTGVADDDLLSNSFLIQVSSSAVSGVIPIVSITELDDDVQQIVLSQVTAPGGCPATAGAGLSGVPKLGVVTEGDPNSKAQICVSLRYQPPSSATLDLTVSPGNSILTSVSTVPIVFTTSTWEIPQLLTFIAVADTNAASETGRMVTLSLPGTEARTVTMDTKDTDVIALKFIGPSNGGVTLRAGETGAIGVRLTYDPITTTTVFCGVPAGPVTFGDSATYTFSGGASGNWATMQIMRLDAGLSGSTSDVTVTCQASGQTPAVPFVGGTFVVHFLGV